MKKLTLEVSYIINGNSTDMPIDTLAIAVDGRDSNDIDDGGDVEHYAREYVLNNYDYESDMLNEATKAELKKWLNDPDAQAQALKEYTEKCKDAVLDYKDESSNLYKAVQSAIDDAQNDNYREWIHGDRSNWAGILSMATRKYGGEIDFEDRNGEVYASIPDEVIQDWKEDGYIARKTQAYKHLESLINSDARNEFYKKQEQSKKRKEERERLAKYKKEQADEAEKARKERIKKLIK